MLTLPNAVLYEYSPECLNLCCWCTLTQNPGMAETGRALWGPSAADPAPARTPRAGCPGSHPGSSGRSPRRRPHTSGQPVPVLHHCTARKGSWCSEGTSCAPVCAHGLWSWQHTPLTEPGCSLWHFHSGIYGCWWDPPEPPLLQPSSHSSFNLSSWERCFRPFPILVSLHWTQCRM